MSISGDEQIARMLVNEVGDFGGGDHGGILTQPGAVARW